MRAFVCILLLGCKVVSNGFGTAAVSSRTCEQNVALFDASGAEVLKACASCHKMGGLSGNTRLVLTDDRDENLRRLSALAAETIDGESLLVMKATARTMHGGGQRFAADSAAARTLGELMAGLNGAEDACFAAKVLPPPVIVTLADFDAQETRKYLNSITPTLVGRVLSPAEQQLVRERAGEAIPLVLQGLRSDPGLPEGARRYIERLLSVSGMRDGIDFSFPGNLAADLVKRERPWTELLTAEMCVNQNGGEVACDSGAPYGAGVLTTRAFLAGRASRFNLTRAGTLMKSFACQTYPLPADLEPRIDKTELIPMFRATTPEEQTDERAKSGFGNGFGCYDCHGQFSIHAQLFVKFDRKGMYRPEALGLQDPAGELGNAPDNLMASHKVDPAAAANERSRMFGREVENLRGAALVMASSPTFLSCQARHLLELVLDASAATVFDAALLSRIADAASARAVEKTPRFLDLVVAVFSDPVVIASALERTP